MSTFLPTSSACHSLQLPRTEKDDRLNLNVRTGSASTLYNSFVFTFGGLTIGLELQDDASIDNILQAFKQQSANNKYKDLNHYMSGELFCLDLIGKEWTRIKFSSDAARPKPRMFHELTRGKGCVYVFGGLAIPDDSAGPEAVELEPLNDLWEFNLEERKWILLHDGTNDPSAPCSRYCIKMTLIESLPSSKNRDHPGLIIAGGMDASSKPLYSNVIFDLIDKKYVKMSEPLMFCTSKDKRRGKKELENFSATDENGNVNVNYLNSIIIDFQEDVDAHRHSKDSRHPQINPHQSQKDNEQQIPELIQESATKEEESIIIYSPVVQPEGTALVNPLLSFKIGPKVGKGKMINLQKHKSTDDSLAYQVQRHTIPLNLRYPTGGLFGHNVVITGFLPNDLDISIFIFNKPTGIWSRLNVFCHHEYGSHRFWGGFVWLSHHKVILLGNNVTSRTTSSVRFFSSLITVSLPVTNILASFELDSDKKHKLDHDLRVGTDASEEVISTSSSFTEDETSTSVLHSSDGENVEIPTSNNALRKYSTISRKSEGKGPQNAISFSDYTHYAAPKAKFTKVRSVFPASAITLGRNAFDRYGDMISDFELISATGDRIPVCLSILVERWGKYFVRLLSKAYVKAIDHFESGQFKTNTVHGVRSSKSSGGSSWSSRGEKKSPLSPEDTESARGSDNNDKPAFHSMKFTKSQQKETLQFRLPFQDTESSSSVNSRESSVAPGISVDPHNVSYDRKNSYTLVSSEPSILASSLQEIPPQLPLPNESIPAVPATPLSYRSSSRKNSTDAQSPRASLIHTLTALRSIPTNFNRSPKASPFASPRGSVSHAPEAFVSMDSIPRLNNQKQVDLSKSGDSFPDAGLATSEPVKKPMSKLKNYTFGQSASDKEKKTTSPEETEIEPEKTHALLNFQDIDPSSFRMEPSLIPRKLYVPCETESLKAYTEYLYTGQVGNKWALHPCALDCLLMSRFYEIPHLYDLLCEVLFGIVGRKEAHLVREGRKLKEKFVELLRQRDDTQQPKFYFPLDVYEGLMNTVDDGYLDMALLRKSTRIHKNSVSTISTKTARSSTASSSTAKPNRNSTGGKNDKRSESSAEGADSDDERLDESSDGEEGYDLLSRLRDFREKKTSFGPRSRSVFDRLAYDSVTRFMVTKGEDDEDEKEASVYATIEQLVSASSPAPSNNVIRLIYETASLCSDVKLMLRSLNVISMTETLHQTEMEYERLAHNIQHMESCSPDSHGSQFGTPGTTPRLSVASTIVMSNPSTPIDPPRSLLQTLALTLNSSRAGTPEVGRSASQPDITRSPTVFKLTPYNKKPETVESNKEVDRRITQMIKHDERMKQKVAKEEKAKRHQLEKLTKRKGRDDLDAVSMRNDDLELLISVSTVKLGLFKKIGNRIIHPQATADPARLSRTELTTSMVSGSSKNSGKKGFFGLRKKR